MKKVFLIGWKDLTLAFRDRAALILMLIAPFALTLGLGFVTGSFSNSGSTGIGNIPVVLVNQDNGQLGKSLIDVFQSEELADLVSASVIDDPNTARKQVDDDEIAAAVIIPAGFTDSIISASGTALSSEVIQVIVYTNPTRPTSSGVIKTIVDEFVSRVEIGRVSGQVIISQLIGHGLIEARQAGAIGERIGAGQANQDVKQSSILLKNVTSEGEAVQFDPMALMAPGMALMFLMFTVSNGGRSLLAERNHGTLPRLLVSPTSTTQVLAGKIFGIYLTGVAQMLILILATALLFQVNWGNQAGVLVLILAAVAGASGWGMLITALAKTPGQVATVGSAMMLLFGILGGSFINMENMHPLFQLFSKITPNAWGLDGFTILAMGGRLNDIVGTVIALLVMGAALFSISIFLINRKGIMRP